MPISTPLQTLKEEAKEEMEKVNFQAGPRRPKKPGKFTEFMKSKRISTGLVIIALILAWLHGHYYHLFFN